MAATTITRESMTNGVTVWNVARIGSAIYDRIDNVLAGNVNIGGTLGSEGFGTHLFAASGTGVNALTVRHTSAGTGNEANLNVGNNSSASLLQLRSFSSTFTSTGGAQASGSAIWSNGAGGFDLVQGSTGDVRLWTGGVLRLTASTAGLFTFGTGASISTLPAADGSVSLPSHTFSSDLNTGMYWASADKFRIAAGGADIMEFDYSASGVFATVKSQSTSNNGPTLTIERNTTSAPGILSLYDKAGTRYYLWVSSTGKLYINTAAPTVVGGDTTGTVVGTQT